MNKPAFRLATAAAHALFGLVWISGLAVAVPAAAATMPTGMASDSPASMPSAVPETAPATNHDALPATTQENAPDAAGADLRTALEASGPLTVAGARLDRDDLLDFYKARDFRPAWTFNGADNRAAFAAFLASLSRVIAWHGLLAERYPLGTMRNLAAASGGAGRVRLELLVTGTLLRLAHDMHGDDIDLGQLYPGWDFHRNDIDIPAALEKAVEGGTTDAFLDGLAPKNPAYDDLARALERYRAMPAWKPIAPGPALKPGMAGSRVVQLRTRLAAAGLKPPVAANQADYFDGALREALRIWQARHGFAADGSAGPHTLAALDVSRAARLTQIRANMERWRHMPEDFPPARYVMVNITDASVAVVEDGRPAYDGLAIVGRPDRKTPFIDSTIRSMIINPAWHVPANIARKDILPKLRKDPHYLEKLGFTIDDPDDPYGQHIDWKALKDQAFDFRLRQGPGKLNSLGRLKFDFTNDFAVYMHGTPHQALFAKERRMLSSGCVRLRDPEKVAAILLAGNEGDWDDAHIEAAIASGKTRWLAIADPIPVFFVYWTAFPDAEGNIQFRDDLYGYDDFLMDSLREEENPQHAAWHPQKIIAFP